nr:MAG TPA: ubiquitin-binding domain protein [Caudoviricetes sp.]
MTQFKSVKSLRALFWGVDYKFEDEKKAILSLLNQSLEALENKDYETAKTLLLMIKFGGL